MRQELKITVWGRHALAVFITSMTLGAILLGVSHSLLAAPAPVFNLADRGARPGLENPFLIEGERDLETLAAVVNAGMDYTIGNMTAPYAAAHYQMTREINLLGELKDVPRGVPMGTSNFTPIGTSENFFAGSFDGNGYAIIGLRYHSSKHKMVGLFGVIRNARLMNVTLSNASFTNRFFSVKNVESISRGSAGGISREIMDCISVVSDVEGDKDVFHASMQPSAMRQLLRTTTSMLSPPIIFPSRIVASTINPSAIPSSIIYATTSLEAVSEESRAANVLSYTGGLVGLSCETMIENSAVNGIIVGGIRSSVGGFVGFSVRTTIENSAATGDALGGDGATIGGFVGVAVATTINAVKATGMALGGDRTSIGGLVGVANETAIKSSVAMGTASGGEHANIGGFIGFAENGTYIDSHNVSGSFP